MGNRTKVVISGCAAMAVALLAGIAFACVPQAGLKVSPGTGGVGTKITITGSSFDSSGSPVTLYWDGASSGTRIGAFAVKDRAFTATFEVPATAAGGAHIISATQNDANGNPIAASPVNASFVVTGAAPAAAAPANLQGEPDQSVVEPARAAAPAAQPAPAPAAAPAPRVRPAPAQTAVRSPAPAAAPSAAAAPAAVATPAPAVEATPAPVAAPAPAAPAPAAAPATAPPRRSAMVSMAGGSDGSPALAIALVGIGLVLALGASALVLAGRREAKAPAQARR